MDRTRIEERMNFTRENYRMMREELLKIVYWSADAVAEGERRPPARGRIEAAKNVVMMDLALLAAGIFCPRANAPLSPSHSWSSARTIRPPVSNEKKR
jgi:hypothetical protein